MVSLIKFKEREYLYILNSEQVSLHLFLLCRIVSIGLKFSKESIVLTNISLILNNNVTRAYIRRGSVDTPTSFQ